MLGHRKLGTGGDAEHTAVHVRLDQSVSVVVSSVECLLTEGTRKPDTTDLANQVAAGSDTGD